MPGFMFATGIENSHPTVAGGARVDEMEKCGHYRRWKQDLALVKSLDIHHLRWGPATYNTFLRPGVYEWSWVDDVLAEMQRLGIEPILDLLHFGLPDWLGNFQNREFPDYFAEYADAFAQRHPHVKHWTPVNEILVTALFSALYGWWNERLASDDAFVRALLNISRANLLAMRAILRHVPDAIFVQSETSEYIHPSQPNLISKAEFYNERRFLPLDLTYGHCVCSSVYRYLMAHGMEEDEYAFFMNQDVRYRCIMGTDYYVTNEHLLRPDGTLCPAGETFGYYVIAHQYYRRYGLPLMHTETNIAQEQGAAQWLWKQWSCMLQLRRDGVPIVGFTWYGLTDFKDWDSMLCRNRGHVNAVGLFDLRRRMREVGGHYQRLIEQWRTFLPAGSSALMLV
jgi:beta-glucosidase/6-phospho-beta-glucosidase/beta-galactosidase